MTKEIKVQRFSGQALERYIPDLAQLRIEVFRDFPYLYDGDLAYEENYLQTYIRCPQAVIVLALDGEQVVGASTGIPMQFESAEFIQPFPANGYDPARIFYCAESVLKKEYRGLGLGVRFFEEREAHALELGGFDYFSFCCVQRPDDHPLKPANHVPLDRFWQKRGYTKHPELQTRYKWKDLGESEETYKDMTFWLKKVPL
jgi:GNAT superfamily N-acetyltransferase